MKKIESKKLQIKNSAENIFNFLNDFNNFENLMPEQVINWKSTEDTCSFTIQGMTDLALKMEERHPFSKIVIVPNGKAPFDFKLICLLSEKDEKLSQAQIIINAGLNPFLSMVATTPLTNLVNIMVEKLKEISDLEE